MDQGVHLIDNSKSIHTNITVRDRGWDHGWKEGKRGRYQESRLPSFSIEAVQKNSIHDLQTKERSVI